MSQVPPLFSETLVAGGTRCSVASTVLGHGAKRQGGLDTVDYRTPEAMFGAGTLHSLWTHKHCKEKWNILGSVRCAIVLSETLCIFN